MYRAIGGLGRNIYGKEMDDMGEDDMVPTAPQLDRRFYEGS